jgi:hypothetical protein
LDRHFASILPPGRLIEMDPYPTLNYFTYSFYIDPAVYSVGEVLYFQGVTFNVRGLTGHMPLTVTDPGVVLQAPQNVDATPFEGQGLPESDLTPQVKITWDHVPGVEDYLIYRSSWGNYQGMSHPGELVGYTRNNFWWDNGPGLDEDAFYSVRTVNSQGQSFVSEIELGHSNPSNGIKYRFGDHKEWYYNGNNYWGFPQVRIGNSGTQVVGVTYSGDIFVIPTGEGHVPTPTSYRNLGGFYFDNSIGAARFADVNAVIYVNRTIFNPNVEMPDTTHIEKFTSSGITDWEYEFPGKKGTGCSFTRTVIVSDSGDLIIGLSYQVVNGVQRVHMVSLDRDGNILYEGIPFDYDLYLGGTGSRSAVLSADGNTLAIQLNQGFSWTTLVLDSRTGAVLGHYPGLYSTGGLDISDDGKRVVATHLLNDLVGTAIVRVFDYPFANQDIHDLTSSGNFIQFGPVAISGDGNKIVSAYFDRDAYSAHVNANGIGDITGGVMTWDVSSIQNPQIVSNYMYTPEQNTFKRANSIEMTDDGSKYVVSYEYGATGLGWNSLSEFRVVDAATPDVYYFEDGQIDPVKEFYFHENSIYYSDLSPDGSEYIASIFPTAEYDGHKYDDYIALIDLT